MGIEVQKLPLEGAFVLVPFWFRDNRGVFLKFFTRKVLSSQGVKPVFMEEYLVRSRKGVLRGLHYQQGKYGQAKLITCLKGEIYDVIVDMRKNSKTYLKWVSARLSERNRKILYVPRWCAHGYFCTKHDTLVLYKVDNPYSPSNECGIRWNDPSVGIRWPSTKPVLSEKDKSWEYI